MGDSLYPEMLVDLIESSREILADLPKDKSLWTDRQRSIAQIVDEYDAWVLLNEASVAANLV